METHVIAEPVEGFFADVLPLADDTPVDRRRVVAAVVARGGVPFKTKSSHVSLVHLLHCIDGSIEVDM